MKQSFNSQEFNSELILEEFNKLSDEKIKLLFEDNDLSDDYKSLVAESCCQRINQLPFSIFINIVSYIENPLVLITNYKNKMNSITYEEIVSLLFEGCCSPECLLAIKDLEIFRNHLKFEINEKKEVKLQVFDLSSKIYTSESDISKLDLIGNDISKLLLFYESNPIYSEDIASLIDAYLSAIVEKFDEIESNSNIFFTCIDMLNFNLKCHRVLDFNMIKFYILYRIKELNLDSYCKEIMISYVDNPNSFGDFQCSTKTLRIFYNYVKNVFRPIFEANKLTNEMANNDLINLVLIQMISHELGHVLDGKKINDFQSTNDTQLLYDKIVTDPFLNYWYRNGTLRLFLGYDQYVKNHSEFIEEKRADLFAIMDCSLQLDKNFKNGFSEKSLQYFSAINAKKIIEFYTEKTEKGLKICTPMQKFDKFYTSQMPNNSELLDPYLKTNINTLNDSIMENLLLGDSIPQYILEKILKFANDQEVTNNIFFEIEKLIDECESLESKHEQQTESSKK